MGIPTTNELRAIVQRHTVEAWFPRSLDLQRGGFFCDFDRQWRHCGPHHKLLEFQSRQTWIAADLLLSRPGDDRLRQAVTHGFRYLRETMWDHRLGGWFHLLDRQGEPLEGRTKHAHGMAYAINACVAVHAAIGEVGALELAKEGFNWLEEHAHDREHGGYFGFLKENGEIIESPSACPWPAVRDTIDTPIGLKDANVQSDMLETLTDLYRAWPDPKVEERLRELARIICQRMTNPTGALWYFCLPDWTPVPYITYWGTAFQTVHRLLAIRDRVEPEMASTMTTCAVRLLETAIQFGFDAIGGGFFHAGPAIPARHLQGHDLSVRRKSWWVQTEAVKALWAACVTFSNNETYKRHLNAAWHYLRSQMFDDRYGGIYVEGLETLPRWQKMFDARMAPLSHVRKGSTWKDAAHDGWACLYCATTPLPE